MIQVIPVGKKKRKKTLCSNRVSQGINHTPEQDQRPQVIDQHKTAFIYVSGCFVFWYFSFIIKSVIHSPTWEKNHKVFQPTLLALLEVITILLCHLSRL